MGKQVRYWAVIVPASAVAAWIAVMVVPAYRVGAPVVTFLLIGVVFAVLYRYLPWPAHLALRPLERHAARLLNDEDDRDFFAPIKFLWLVIGIRFLVLLLVTVLVSPVAFWLGALLATAIGLPVRMGGFWPTVVASLIVVATRQWLAQPLRLLWGSRRLSRAIRAFFELAIPFGGIAVAVAVLGGVRLDPGPWPRQLLTLVVLTAVSLVVTLEVTVPYVTTLLRVVGNGLKLWLLALFSEPMALSLHIDGFWWLVFAALITTGANWFLRLARPPKPPPLPDPLLHDPFWPHHQMPLY